MQYISDFMDRPVVGGGNTFVTHAKFGSQLGKCPLVQNMGKKDIAVPWLNPLECLLQAGGIKLRGGIEISILHNHTRNIPQSVVKILMAIDLVPCSKQVRLLPQNGSFEIPTKSLLQDIWFTFSTVPIFQGRLHSGAPNVNDARKALQEQACPGIGCL